MRTAIIVISGLMYGVGCFILGMLVMKQEVARRCKELGKLDTDQKFAEYDRQVSDRVHGKVD